MKTKTFQMLVTATFITNGVADGEIKQRLGNMIRKPYLDGTISGDSPLVLDKIKFTIKSKSKISRRKKGEHRFSDPTNGIPHCVTCGCDEDDAFVGGQECTFGN